jgi:hypothetical protein
MVGKLGLAASSLSLVKHMSVCRHLRLGRLVLVALRNRVPKQVSLLVIVAFCHQGTLDLVASNLSLEKRIDECICLNH